MLLHFVTLWYIIIFVIIYIGCDKMAIMIIENLETIQSEVIDDKSAYEKEIDSIFGNIKSLLLSEVPKDNGSQYLEWCNILLSDTIKYRKENDLNTLIKNCRDTEERTKLKKKRAKYKSKNYPSEIQIGDIFHIDFGYGYCSEISDGHYAIILSEIKANMFLVLPISSTSLKIFEYCVGDLKLPRKDKREYGKLSYLRFDQLRYVNYRRITCLSDGSKRDISSLLPDIYIKLNEFLNLTIDNSEK